MPGKFLHDCSTKDLFLQLYGIMHLVFWPLDVFANFNTGFYQKGVLNLNRSNIAKNYLQTWALFDIAVVAVDWVSWLATTATQGNTDVGYLRTLRTARYLRAFRSIRVLRFLAERVTDLVQP